MEDIKKNFLITIFISLAINIPFLYLILNYITISLIFYYFFSISAILTLIAGISVFIHYLLVNTYFFDPMLRSIKHHENQEAVEESYIAAKNFPMYASFIGSFFYLTSIVIISIYLKYKMPNLSYNRLFLSFISVFIVAFFHYIIQFLFYKKITQKYFSILLEKYDFFLNIQQKHNYIEELIFKKTLIAVFSLIIIFTFFLAFVFYSLDRSRESKILLSLQNKEEIREITDHWRNNSEILRFDSALFDTIIFNIDDSTIIDSNVFLDSREADRIIALGEKQRIRINDLFFIEDSNDRFFYMEKVTEDQRILFRFDITKYESLSQTFPWLNYIIIAYGIAILISIAVFIANSYDENFKILINKIDSINKGGIKSRVSSVISHTEFSILDQQINRIIFRFREIFDNISEIDTLINSVSGIAKDKLYNISEHIKSTKDMLKNVHQDSISLKSSFSKDGSIVKDLSSGAERIYNRFSDFSPLITKVSNDISNIKEAFSDDIILYENFYNDISNMHNIIDTLFHLSSDNSSGLSELDASVKHIQGITNEIRGLAQSTFKSSESGEAIIDNTRNAFYQINENFANITKLINDLGEKTKNIDFIIEVIHEIAKKTNLLSLNASIIASQSGEYGKSFLIVANEIHTLAEKTTISIKDIEKMVASIKSNVNNISSALDKSKSTLDSGLELIENAGKTLTIIVDKAKTTLDQIRIIYKSITEQSDSTHMITDNSQVIYDDLKSIIESINHIKDRFAKSLQSKDSLKEHNSTILKALNKISSNLLLFENDFKELNDNIKGLDESIVSSSEGMERQTKILSQLSSIYERDDRIIQEIEVLLSEIQKINESLNENFKKLQ